MNAHTTTAEPGAVVGPLYKSPQAARSRTIRRVSRSEYGAHWHGLTCTIAHDTQSANRLRFSYTESQTCSILPTDASVASFLSKGLLSTRERKRGTFGNRSTPGGFRPKGQRPPGVLARFLKLISYAREYLEYRNHAAPLETQR